MTLLFSMRILVYTYINKYRTITGMQHLVMVVLQICACAPELDHVTRRSVTTGVVQVRHILKSAFMKVQMGLMCIASLTSVSW